MDLHASIENLKVHGMHIIVENLLSYTHRLVFVPFIIIHIIIIHNLLSEKIIIFSSTKVEKLRKVSVQRYLTDSSALMYIVY